MKALRELAAAEGFAALRWEVQRDNEAAVSLYSRLGAQVLQDAPRRRDTPSGGKGGAVHAVVLPEVCVGSRVLQRPLWRTHR